MRPVKTAWRYRALGRFFEAADKLVPDAAFGALDPAGLMAAANTSPGPEAAAGLEKLLAAIAADCELTLFGRISVRWDMVRLLRNAARIAAAHAAQPALAAAPVTAPIFILGLPRSGTTFLHGLLAEDPASLVPRQWQTIAPAPRPPDFDAARSAPARRVDQQLKMFDGMAPGFAASHPVTADSPQECSEITAHAFRSYRFDTTFRVPDYLAWLDAEGDLPAFTFHKQFLQFLQDGQKRNWVLKCPDHIFSLDAILATYPDARFIVVHRDPMQVLASNARLTALLRRPFLRNNDPAEIGRLEAARWIEGANRLLAFDTRGGIAADRKIHIFHDDLIAAPLARVIDIYRHFSMPLEAGAIAAMTQQIAAAPHGGYARHAPYPLSHFGLNTESLRAGFAAYVERFCRATPARS